MKCGWMRKFGFHTCWKERSLMPTLHFKVIILFWTMTSQKDQRSSVDSRLLLYEPSQNSIQIFVNCAIVKNHSDVTILSGDSALLIFFCFFLHCFCNLLFLALIFSVLFSVFPPPPHDNSILILRPSNCVWCNFRPA